MHSVFIRLVVAAIAATATAAALAQVVPPPLPPGSNLVRPETGLNEDERKRYVRAHHHKGHHKKDVTHDDSLYGHDKAKDAPRGNAGGRDQDKKK